MEDRTRNRYFSAALLVVTFTLSTGLTMAQEREARPVELQLQSACPRPLALTLTATTPNVVNADFTATQLGAPRSFLNNPTLDKSFLYTFEWKREEACCEIGRAVLTVKLQANGGGMAKTSPDAGNDGIAIMHLGTSVAPFTEAVYSSWPFSPGQVVTKTWNLTGAALNYLNADHRLSIYVQDDTRVVSATLQISGCCLSPQKVKSETATVMSR